jgi:hypothetical protein
MDSKNASEKERLLIESVIKNGRVPKRDKTIQKHTTIKTPSLSRKSFLVSLKGHQRIKPPNPVKANDNRKEKYSLSE